jgi:hypothetical protein
MGRNRPCPSKRSNQRMLLDLVSVLVSVLMLVLV